jgi:hypothetical protein
MAPAVMLLAWGIPMTLLALIFVFGLDETFGFIFNSQRLIGSLIVFGGFFALIALLQFAKSTIQEKRYLFGFQFWIALCLGFYAAYYLWSLFGWLFTATVFFPLLVLTVHFSVIQVHFRHGKSGTS